MSRIGRAARTLWPGGLLCLTALAFANEGVVWTLDGRRLQGDVRFDAGALVVKPAQGGEVSVAATNIARAQFSTNVIAAQTKGSGNGLLGIYYKSTNLTGTAVIRLDETVDFDWQEKEPIPGVPRDLFGVRWMGQIEAPTTDAYTIYFATDDGGRIYLDDKLVADTWSRRGYSETNATVNLKAGERHNLKLEYFDFLGSARARLSWGNATMSKTIIPQGRLYAASFDGEHRGDASSLAGSQGLLATYFNSGDFTGNSFTRIDPEINFEWKDQSPAPEIATNNFSVCWSGNLWVTNSGSHTFYVFAGLPLRLFINDKLISSPWMAALEQAESVMLKAGEPCELRLEVRATNVVMPVRLFWSGPGFGKTLITRQHLSPAISPVREAPTGTGPIQPAGVVLLNGAIIGAPIQSANNSSIRFQGFFSKQPVPLTKVARIHVKPLTTDLSAALPKGRAGVLLKSRDFIDGDFAGIENGRLKIESVLFGNRAFDLAKEVIAVVLRGHEPPAWRYSLTARDGTTLYGKAITITEKTAALAEASELSVPSAEVTEMARQIDSASAYP